MSELKFDGAHGSIIVRRRAYFECELLARDGKRWPITWPPTPGGAGAPFYALLCEQANRSAGVVLVRGTSQLGWKRKADAVLAAQELQRILGAPQEADEQEDDHEDREEGVRIWFSWSQLVVLRRLVEEGSGVILGLSAHDNHLREVVEDKLDSAHRSLMARNKEK